MVVVFRGTGHGKRNNRLDFGGSPDHDLNIFESIFFIIAIYVRSQQ